MSETQLVTLDQIALAAKECCEILPGYKLERRLGSGGFGEVWKACAPGGLEKAVKILYGQISGQQAETELKSLKRIRGLHHPFLLNIERIEISGERLIIVTELAEQSLEDRFQACRQLDWEGIPYEELVGYLRDAADALDYMFARLGLQHLDVKPDNLLLQGGHVKVADFGLTKDLSQTHVSLIGAFTPLYAPPELYEGEPAASSDQYSLAIVYQTMLTGVPPFVGRTAAQLAAQHLSSQPNLQPLPMSDRPVIARALSKNPEARFASCREFIDELSLRRSNHAEPAPRGSSSGGGRPRSAKNPPQESLSGSTELFAVHAESKPLGHVEELPAHEVTYRPTLVIGLGGLAGHLLRDLKHRVKSRYDGEPGFSGLGFLYLDSDPQAMTRALRGPEYKLDYQETLPIPLRSPQEYKSDDLDFSNWLSRRWLYNIPRSRQVEGMRALGRLAFVDHQQKIRQQLRERLKHIISEESLAVLKTQTGLDFTACPNVLILASIMGGTGSGAALDLGYLVQDELSAMGLEESEVDAFLLFGTDARDCDRDVAIANGLCLLKELEHFHRAHYPGDPSCELPDIPKPPFQNSYVLHLGNKLSDAQLAEDLASISESIYRRTCTPARRGFQAVEKHAKALAQPNEWMHTFGARHIDPLPVAERKSSARQLTNAILASWLKPLTEAEQDALKPHVISWCDSQLAARDWRLNSLLSLGLAEVRQFEDSQSGGQVFERLRSEARHFTIPAPSLREPWAKELAESVQKVFAETQKDHAPEPPQTRIAAFQTQLEQRTRTDAASFQNALWSALDAWPHPFDAALLVAERTIKHLDACRQQLLQATGQISRQLAVFFPQALENLAPRPKPVLLMDELRQMVADYTGLKFCLEVHRALFGVVETILSWVGSWPSLLAELRQRVENIVHADVAPAGGHAAGEISTWLQSFSQELCRQNHRPLNRLAQIGTESDGNWLLGMEKRAEDFLLCFVGHSLNQLSLAHPVDQLCEGASPQLQGVGGLHHRLLVLPSANSTEYEAQAKTVLGDSVSCVLDPQQPAFLCCETRNLPFGAVYNSLAERREDLKEIAERLHSRMDIDW